MILWNLRFAAALFTPCACVIYKVCIRNEQGRLTFEERTPRRSVRNSRRNPFSYGSYRANTKPLVRRKAGWRREKGCYENKSASLACRIAVGRSDAAQNEHRRKDWPGALRHLSRQFHFHGCRGVRANAALRKRSPRRRLHQYHPRLAARHREKPGVPDRRAHQPTASQIKIAAAGWCRF